MVIGLDDAAKLKRVEWTVQKLTLFILPTLSPILELTPAGLLMLIATGFCKITYWTSARYIYVPVAPSLLDV